MLLALLACDHPVQTPSTDPGQAWLGPELEEPVAVHMLEDTGFPYDALVSELAGTTGVTGTFMVAEGNSVIAPMDWGIHEWTGPVDGIVVMSSGASRSITVPEGTAADRIPGFTGAAWGDGLAVGEFPLIVRGYDADWEPVFKLRTDADYGGVTNVNAGELTGDDVDDIVWTDVTCNGSNNHSYVSVLDGTFRGWGTEDDVTAVLGPAQPNDGGFGCVPHAPGDLNGDGVGDLLVDANWGYVFYGPVTNSGDASDADVVYTDGWHYTPGPDGDGDGVPEVALTVDGGVYLVDARTPGGRSISDAQSSYHCGTVQFMAPSPLGDLDDDGSEEMLIESYPRDGGGFELWMADAESEGAWQCRDLPTVLVEENGFVAYSASATDLDSDGVAEVAVRARFEKLEHYRGIIFLPLDLFEEGE